jgi:hypothetical protein
MKITNTETRGVYVKSQFRLPKSHMVYDLKYSAMILDC